MSAQRIPQGLKHYCLDTSWSLIPKLFLRYCGMLVAQGGQTVLLALVRELATHATVLKITNMVGFLTKVLMTNRLNITRSLISCGQAIEQIHFVGAADYGEGRLSH